MCLGGGGGDGGAAQREAGRQAKQDEAIARVNKLFGIYTPTQTSRPNEADYRTRPGPRGQRRFDKDAYQQALQDWEQQDPRKEQAEAAKKARESLYEQTREDVNNYYTNDLNKQRTITDRQARFGLARRGVMGGSSELDTSGDIFDEYKRGVLRIGNRADQAVTSQRTADERARLDLISRIRAGMSADSAVQSANATLQNNLENARTNTMANSLGQVFSDYGYYVTENARNRGNQQGNGIGRTFYGNPKSYNGR